MDADGNVDTSNDVSEMYNEDADDEPPEASLATEWLEGGKKRVEEEELRIR